LGALHVASEIFRETPSGRKNILVIYSDMRQATRTLDLEAPGTLRVVTTMAAVEQ
jgi:hypothetical protein